MEVITELKVLACSECGVPFGMPGFFVDSRRGDHKSFYCPNGHSQHFPQQTEAERLRKQLHATNLEKERAEKSLQEALAEQRRLLTRCAAGTCPHCNRTFKQLRAHMQRKHPEVT